MGERAKERLGQRAVKVDWNKRTIREKSEFPRFLCDKRPAPFFRQTSQIIQAIKHQRDKQIIIVYLAGIK